MVRYTIITGYLTAAQNRHQSWSLAAACPSLQQLCHNYNMQLQQEVELAAAMKEETLSMMSRSITQQYSVQALNKC